ncbi:hypothetical protein EYS14_23660 [Alteromonadaceae bacterium M269]|nr:hypothetical protein EYS14_23660 [Alteromonadaceae bacterium M269]
MKNRKAQFSIKFFFIASLFVGSALANPIDFGKSDETRDPSCGLSCGDQKGEPLPPTPDCDELCQFIRWLNSQ